MEKSSKNILTAFLLNFLFVIIELVGGIITGSVAILSDSIHDAGDCFAIGVAFLLEKKDLPLLMPTVFPFLTALPRFSPPI